MIEGRRLAAGAYPFWGISAASSHVFLRNFLHPLNHLQPPISDSSPLACYSWKMSTPKQVARRIRQRSKIASPRSARAKASFNANSLNTSPLPDPKVLPGEPSQKPKANFAQPQSAQQKIGFVPSFCPTPELVPSPLDALSRRCRNPSGGRAEGASKTSKSSPSPLFRSRPELPEPRTASHPPAASPKRLRTQPRPPTCPVVL
jgi:hypothetical protein